MSICCAKHDGSLSVTFRTLQKTATLLNSLEIALHISHIMSLASRTKSEAGITWMLGQARCEVGQHFAVPATLLGDATVCLTNKAAP